MVRYSVPFVTSKKVNNKTTVTIADDNFILKLVKLPYPYKAFHTVLYCSIYESFEDVSSMDCFLFIENRHGPEEVQKNHRDGEYIIIMMFPYLEKYAFLSWLWEQENTFYFVFHHYQ